MHKFILTQKFSFLVTKKNCVCNFNFVSTYLEKSFYYSLIDGGSSDFN